MNFNQNIEDIEKAFFSDGYKFGLQAMKTKLSRDSLFLSISKMYAGIDELIHYLSILSNKHGQLIQCKKGCAFCCHQPVFVLDYEMQYLHKFIKKNFTEQKQSELKTRANQNRVKLSRRTEKEILNSKLPCPLLENQKCSIYEARPMACRIYLSTSVGTCLKFYDSPEDKTNFPELLEFPMQAGKMMNQGFKSALKTQGFISKEFRIEEKLLERI